jgi:hypothetical protein
MYVKEWLCINTFHKSGGFLTSNICCGHHVQHFPHVSVSGVI